MRLNETVNRQLTIAHFMPWTGIGGVEIATLRLVEATRERFRHVAFCLDDAVSLRNSFEKLGIETVTYTPPEPSLRHARRFNKESRVVARQFRQAEADIVHFADEKAAYHGSLGAFLARSSTVCHIRSSIEHRGLREKFCFWPVQSFIFVSKESRRTFELSLPNRKGRVIYDSVEVRTGDIVESNAAVRREFRILPQCVVIGMVARVAQVKDYYTLASAAAEVLRRHPNTCFLIVGDNSSTDLYRQHYMEVVRKLNELGIADKFIFTGHRDDVSRLIAAMDISVLCTHREGFPLSILELMAMRKPVVATAVGGIPEVIEHGVTGYLHQHENSKELADAIIHLIENPEEAKRIGDAGYEHVRQNYSRQKFVDEISRAYWDVMRR
jgi:glycosyltransferase involved in cell wall biosynthesis